VNKQLFLTMIHNICCSVRECDEGQFELGIQLDQRNSCTNVFCTVSCTCWYRTVGMLANIAGCVYEVMYYVTHAGA